MLLLFKGGFYSRKYGIFIEMVICVAVGVVMLNHGLVDPDLHVA